MVRRSPTIAGAWRKPRRRPTFTVSQDAHRTGGTGCSLSLTLVESAGRTLVTGWWPHSIKPSTCTCPTAPAPPHGRMALGLGKGGSAKDTEPCPSRGAGWRDRSDLRSDFTGRKGEGRGTSDKSAGVALFYPFSLLTVAQACSVNAAEVELFHTQSRARSNLGTILSRNNTGILLQGPCFRYVQFKANKMEQNMCKVFHDYCHFVLI